MKRLHLSQTLDLPLDACTQTFAWIGRKGSGKTYGSGKLVEELIAADVQVVILDTVGNWYGLRLSADGKGKGYDIPVFGGLRQDIPLLPTAGDVVADVIVDTGRSVIVDLSQFNFADRKRFAASFGERLWQRKKGESTPAPLHLVIEECQLIVPQFVGKDETRMVHVYEEIIRLGRNYGIGVSMITQRPQSVNKEVLTQTECLVVFQVNGVPERKALKEWITHEGADVNLVDALPSLERGSAWLWSPQWLRKFEKITIAKKTTFDASATPKAGEITKRREPAPLDVADIAARMKDTIEKSKADDPKALKAKVHQLEQALKKSADLGLKATAQVVNPTIIVKPDEKSMCRLEKILDRIVQERTRHTDAMAALMEKIEPLQETIVKSLRLFNAPAPVVPASRPIGTTAPPMTFRQPKPVMQWADMSAEKAIPKGELSILTAVAQHHGCYRDQLTVLTGYKRSSRDAYIQRLMQQGLLKDGRPGEVTMTEEGLKALGSHFEPLPTGAGLRDHWLQRLPDGERKVLQALVDVYPKECSREHLSDVTGYKRSTRDAYIQRLMSRRLVESRLTGYVNACDLLF